MSITPTPDSEAMAEDFPADVMNAADELVTSVNDYCSGRQEQVLCVARALQTERALHYDARWANKAVDDVKAEFAGALWDIRAERQRQIDEEGWTAEHDDENVDRDMAIAASCYAYEAGLADEDRGIDNPPPDWPWHARWWKPTDRRRDLVKAGALIVAEIERIDRAAAHAASADFQAEMKRRAEVAP